jgi:mono/diheme cytochrome c family protein
MLKKLAGLAIGLALAGGIAFWFLSAPRPAEAARLAGLPSGEATRGATVFWAGGCGSCHAAQGAKGDAKLSLGGGLKLKTPFGTFIAPNISSDPADGIGSWTPEQFANAMLAGVSPQGDHYYPAFPYASYVRMSDQDLMDLYAFMKTLPAVKGKAADHKLSFPFNIRRGLGLWKMLFLKEGQVAALASAAPDVARGQYLVEGPGHCGECHTGRNLIGGPQLSKWLAGGAAAEGDGFIPNITAGDKGIGDWSANDIAYYLESGFTPDFDSVGGAMVSVQENMSKLAAEDRAAIAAYLKAIPALPENR